MKIQEIQSKAFQKYGQILSGYDFTEIFAELAKLPIPEEGITYSASVPALEKCRVTAELQSRGFGGMPIQLGYVGGYSSRLDCLEYHKSSEFNIALCDMILVLGQESDIQNGTYELSGCEAFYVPAGTGVELFSTTLHYAPFHCDEKGYRTVCVLPRGTNGEKPDFPEKTAEDRMCAGSNKWLMAHPDYAKENPGVYIGLTGQNITRKGLE